MSQYPHDEFDDIDENTARRGTYRGVIDDPSKSPKGIIPVVVAGILSLVIGGAMYINHPRSNSPEAAARAKSYSAPASPSESSSPSASASEQAKDANVAVYNASAPGGSAAKASSALEGYTITETANWSGTPPQSSTVYYKDEAKKSQAEAIAKTLNITTVQESSDASILGENDIVVVLATDYS